MGYGGSRADAGKALGRSATEASTESSKKIGSVLDFIFIQAKRWADKPDGSPGTADSLLGHWPGTVPARVSFSTTSNFTKEAADYAAGLRNSKIVLIDGDELAELMIDQHGIGVATAATYDVEAHRLGLLR